ncbi:MAG: hypothetical protein WCX61_01415 [Candidatus Peribacteraceae bacterium]|jgi:hypothetical protein
MFEEFSRHDYDTTTARSGGTFKMVIAAVIVLALIAAAVYIGYPIIKKNQFVGMEKSLDALHNESLVELSAMTGSVKLSGSAVKSKDEFMLEVIHKATEGRYGPDGAKQVALFLHENYPNMDTALRQQYIRAVEAGYAKFANVQTRKLQLLREYQRQVDPDTFPSGSWVAKKYGFPRVDLAKYDVILSKEARKADATKTLDESEFDPFAKEKVKAPVKPEAEAKDF